MGYHKTGIVRRQARREFKQLMFRKLNQEKLVIKVNDKLQDVNRLPKRIQDLFWKKELNRLYTNQMRAEKLRPQTRSARNKQRVETLIR